MWKLSSFMCAEGVAVDSMTGRVTAFNLIDSFVVPALPAMLIRGHAIALYDLGDEPATVTERVRLLDPDEGEVFDLSGVIKLEARTPGTMPSGHRSIKAFWKTKLSNSGDHHLVLEHGSDDGSWREVARLRIPVVVAQHEVLNLQAPQIAPRTVVSAQGKSE